MPGTWAGLATWRFGPGKKYQELISALNNPQRPLSADFAVSLVNPVTGMRVVFDDCRETDGTMIEAKGPGFTKMLESEFMCGRIRDRWVKQAKNQVQASHGRAIEWYFAEEVAAAKAEDIFAYYRTLKRKIKIIHIPALVQ